MLQTEIHNEYSLVVGMGATGMSIAKFLSEKGRAFHLFDTRSSSMSSEQFSKLFPTAKQFFETIDDEILLGANEIYLSPGVPRDEGVVKRAIDAGTLVVGDIELFLRETTKPVIGITGSNGKSTVTTLVGLAAEKSGLKVGVGGNIGIPALELLNEQSDLYVLELSSFQLESTNSPHLNVACCLNISADHMDRYESMSHYVMAKQRIYQGAEKVVYSLDDAATVAPSSLHAQRLGFGLNKDIEKNESQFTFSPQTGWLEKEGQALLHKKDIKIKGVHNVRNALALYAIADAAAISQDACREVLVEFEGLPHRCEYVDEWQGVSFINDSKATNVGATRAAISGLAPEYDGLVLIAGGEGKDADFEALGRCINENVRVLILFGKDRELIAKFVAPHVSVHYVTSMDQAVSTSKQIAQDGELVLLSPACASFDMFENFEHRGQIFNECVKGSVAA
ncbi:MAG: UDP-N-acetylmuramoyl-L-alanine--D-glutamate ligase [Agarilytica sp.]